MRIKEPFTIYLRTIKNKDKKRYIFYYKARDENGQQSNGLSTGVEVLNPLNEKELKSKRNKARAICNDLLQQHAIFYKREYLLTVKDFSKDFFTENCDYLKWKKTIDGKGMSQNSIKVYRALLVNGVIPFIGDKIIKNITRSDIKKIIFELKKTYSNKSINLIIVVLNIIFKQAIEKNIIKISPTQNIGVLSVEKKHIELLTIDEIKNLINIGRLKKNRKSIIILLSITGLRIGECLALKKEDIFETYIEVKKSHNGAFGLSETKTREQRKIPFCKTAYDFFNFKSYNSDFLFEENGKIPLSGNILKYTKEHLSKIGIDCKDRGITIHSLRHFLTLIYFLKTYPMLKLGLLWVIRIIQ
ncbi:MAG: tyrosine-type recombinase/integrase [Treponemataceae bacterium]